ncbi:Golgi complex component 7-domain-containing protein [Cunninghamella echinulata]|nr:Golgi complex component 7-domain-containing protein [Cunninghamella echinulata]
MPTTSIDVASFSDLNFDVKKWINNSLSSSHNNNNSNNDTSENSLNNTTTTTLEQETNTLVTKLQLASEHASQQVGQINDQVIKSMPRILYELKLITDDAYATQQGIQQVKMNLNNVELGADDSLEKLRQLHLCKTRMEDCLSALKEAENWNNLETEVIKVINNNDFEGAATRLQNAQRSLDVLQQMPEYEPRRQLLKKLQDAKRLDTSHVLDDLERALKPKVEEALHNRDAEECHKFYKVYGRIGRIDDFVDLYFESRNASLLTTWQSEMTNLFTITNGVNKLDKCLDIFYKSVFSLVSEEYIWCASIFPDPKSVVQALVQNILQSLDPPLDEQLGKIQKQSGASSLKILVSAFIVTESFGLSLERLFSKPSVNTSSSDQDQFNDTQAVKRTHSRRRSKSGSFSYVPLTLRFSESNNWSYSLYEPFLPIQSQYAILEGRLLKEELDLIFTAFNKMKNISSALNVMQNTSISSVGKVFDLLRNSFDRCISLTHGYGTIEWLKTVNNIMADVSKKFDQLMNKVKVLLQDSNNKSDINQQIGYNNNKDDEEPPSRLSLSSDTTDDLDFNMSTENSNDWYEFQIGLQFLSVCESMNNQFKNLEEKIRQILEQSRQYIVEGEQKISQQDENIESINETTITTTTLSSSPREHRRRRSSISVKNNRNSYQHSPNNYYDRQRRSMLDFNGTKQQQEHIRGSEASMALLRTSTLNSHELQTLMSQVSTVTEEGKSDVISKALNGSNECIRTMTESFQLFVHETVHQSIAEPLNKILVLTDLWTATIDDDDDDNGSGEGKKIHDATIDIATPKLSLSPNEYITQVGERLLMLPQQLEVYASDSGLAFQKETVPLMNDNAYDNDFIINGNEGDDRDQENEAAANDEEEVEEEGDENSNGLSNEKVIRLWTTSVARGTMKTFLNKILDIRNLSKSGGRQLRTDIEYLVNVLSALDVQPLPDLIRVYTLLGVDEQGIIKDLMALRSGSTKEDNEILKKVAKIRGVALLEL